MHSQLSLWQPWKEKSSFPFIWGNQQSPGLKVVQGQTAISGWQQDSNTGSLAPVWWGLSMIQPDTRAKGHMINLLNNSKKLCISHPEILCKIWELMTSISLREHLHWSQLDYFRLIINTFLLFKKKSFYRKIGRFQYRYSLFFKLKFSNNLFWLVWKRRTEQTTKRPFLHFNISKHVWFGLIWICGQLDQNLIQKE